MMKDKFRYWGNSHLVLVITILLFVPAVSYGQNVQLGKDSLDNLRKTTFWLDKQSFSDLDNIAKWEAIKAKHDVSVAQRDSLKKVIEEDDSIKVCLINRQKELHSILATTFEASQSDQVYLQCDTTTLLLHQGMYGDSILEIKQEALLIYFRIEKYLTVRYDTESVDSARDILKLHVAKDFPSEYAEIDRRLEQYVAMTKNLRDALASANEIRPKPDATRSQHMTDRYTKEFFAELSKILDSALLSPKSYPYLYGILNKAMEAKMDDPSNDIMELIEKL